MGNRLLYATNIINGKVLQYNTIDQSNLVNQTSEKMMVI